MTYLFNAIYLKLAIISALVIPLVGKCTGTVN